MILCMNEIKCEFELFVLLLSCKLVHVRNQSVSWCSNDTRYHKIVAFTSVSIVLWRHEVNHRRIARHEATMSLQNEFDSTVLSFFQSEILKSALQRESSFQ